MLPKHQCTNNLRKYFKCKLVIYSNIENVCGANIACDNLSLLKQSFRVKLVRALDLSVCQIFYFNVRNGMHVIAGILIFVRPWNYSMAILWERRRLRFPLGPYQPAITRSRPACKEIGGGAWVGSVGGFRGWVPWVGSVGGFRNYNAIYFTYNAVYITLTPWHPSRNFNIVPELSFLSSWTTMQYTTKSPAES